jgi:hypothetical protein
MSMPAESLSITTAPVARNADNLAIDSAKLQRLYQDWLGRRRGRALPARRDFDVLDLKYILGDLSLIEVLATPPRFRFRVHCTNEAERLRVDLTGKTIDDHPDPEHREIAARTYAVAVETRIPQRVLRERARSHSSARRWESLVLPLSADGGRVDTLMVATDLTGNRRE